VRSIGTSWVLVLSKTYLLSDDDEDLSFFEEPDDNSHHHLQLDPGHPEDDFVDDDDLEDFSDLDESAYKDGEYKEPEVDDKDVVVLKEGNFSEFVEKNQCVSSKWVFDSRRSRVRPAPALR
jgi:protein disulfide-isomerase A1